MGSKDNLGASKCPVVKSKIAKQKLTLEVFQVNERYHLNFGGPTNLHNRAIKCHANVVSEYTLFQTRSYE